jgi:lipopolysaccharide heptosyltransferase I
MAQGETARFLIVRLGSLGDLVHTIPAFAALRRHFPNAIVDWVVGQRWTPLISMLSGLNRIISLQRSMLHYFSCARLLHQGRYSCAFDFQGLYKSALLPWLAGIPRRVGRDRSSAREPAAALFYTDRLNPSGEHIADMSLSLLRSVGINNVKLEFPLTVPSQECNVLLEKLFSHGIREYVVISPGGGWRSKCWPPDRYGVLCSELWIKHGIRAVVNVGPGEESLGAEVVRAAASAAPLVIQPSLRELAALVKLSRLVVAADTGPLHLAAALGANVVALFGTTSPQRNGPLPGGRVLVGPQAGSAGAGPRDYARGNYSRGNEYAAAMLSISVEEVLAAAEQEMNVRA